MKRHVTTIMLLFAFMLAAEGAPAQSRNAATWYQRAMDQWYDPATGQYFLNEADWATIESWRIDPSGAPPEELRSILSRTSSMLADVRRGTQEQYADYNLDYSQGFELLLPHLGHLRGMSKLMQANAQLQLHEGNIDGAADQIATMYRLSSHFRDDRTLISSLVGQAVFNVADETAQSAFDRGQFSPEQSTTLLRAVQRLEPTDPFHMTESVAMEQSLVGDWLAGSTPSQDAIAAFAELDGEVLSLSEDEFLDELELYDVVMGTVVEAFMVEDRDEGRALIAQIEQDLEAGEHGVLARAIMPAFHRVFENMVKSELAVEQRIDMLREIVEGDVEPEQTINAAVLYDRGIGVLRSLERSEFDRVLETGADSDTGESIDALFVRCQPAIDLLREGSTKRRCDFGFLRPGRDVRLCFWYVAGMRDGLRLLRADARRLLAAGDLQGATDRLTIGYRVIGHMEQDEPILTAVVAHDALIAQYALTAALLEASPTDPSRRAHLLAAAESMTRKDPFGYISSINASRKLLAAPFRLRYFQTKEERQRADEATERIKHLTGDQLVYLVAILDTVARDETPPEIENRDMEAPKLDPLTRMDGLIDFEALVTVRDGATAAYEQYRTMDIASVFGDGIVPVIADVTARRRDARRDLRETLILLRPQRSSPRGPGDDGAGDR